MPRYQVTLNGEKLSRGFFRTPSPYAVATMGRPEENGAEIGRTETLPRTTNPDWIKTLFLDADASRIMHVTIKVYDDYGIGRDDRLLGSATFEVIEVTQSEGHFQAQPLSDGGGGKAKIILSVVESIPGDHQGLVTMQFRGLDIKNVEPGLLGLGRSDPFFEISKKNADHGAGIVRWNVVYRSDAIQNHLNPYWDPFTLDLEELCNGDLSYPLRVAVYDHQARGGHRLIGKFEATLQHMKERKAVKGNADREMAFELFVEGQPDTHGLICVLRIDFNESE